MAAAGRYTRVIKYVKDAVELARSGAIWFGEGDAAIYFLWGQPSHAFVRSESEMIEGEAALKSLALALGKGGKVAWKSKEVLQKETLRCTAEDLIGILEALRAADKDPPDADVSTDVWDGKDRRRPPAFTYNLNEFPLLPGGSPLWADVPTSVVHLDVLLGTLPSVLVVLEGEKVRAAGVVFQRELHDALYVDENGSRSGREAWEALMQARDGMVTAYELDDRMAEALPVLWRSRIVHRDVDKRWIDGQTFLDSIGSGAEDRAVIVATATKIGVALFLRGEPVGAYTSVFRQPSSTVDEILDIFAERSPGAVSVIERLPEEEAEPLAFTAPSEFPVEEEPPEQQPAEPEAAAPVEAGAGQPVAEPAGDWLSEAAAEPAAEAEPVVDAAEAGSPSPPAPEAAPAPAAAPSSDFAAVNALLGGDAIPPPPAGSAPVSTTRPAQPAPASFFDLGAPAQPVAAAAPVSAAPATAVPALDYEPVIAELCEIGRRNLGESFGGVEPLISDAERSVPGLRRAISTLRRTEIPGHAPEQVAATAREMLVFVAERLSGA